MYNVLVVDDEKYAVAGITQGIDWSEVPIAELREAYSAKQAKDVMARGSVDLLITDIEMPGESGMELLDWVRERFPDTVTIFLTAHADFGYAQQALHLGSYAYIVKPVDYDELKAVVVRALEEIGRNREQKAFSEAYRHYYAQWERQKPLLVERFWQDLLGRRIAASAERIEAAIALYALPLDIRRPVVPVLISVEQWDKELNTRDEEIMEYAIRNSAAEVLLAGSEGIVIQDRSGVTAALLYGDQTADADWKEALKERCTALIGACNRYFYCHLSCYIGEIATLPGLPEAYETLLALEHDNVTASDAVLAVGEARGSLSPGALPFVPADDWLVLFEAGQAEALNRRLEEMFASLRESEATPETLDVVVSAVKHMLYRAFHKRGLSVYGRFASLQTPRTVPQLRTWARQAVADAIDEYRSQGQDNRAVIDKIHQYVQARLTGELSREEIAHHVFLNPAYLSRLYKKETGIALSEYIMQARMNKTKTLLVETNRKVSDIAETVGYQNISHFAKVFRKTVGIGPKEFRKRYQQ
ncbi:response regulator transcription factor [Cohnella nanjingensis]|uniref:Response regulator n=1 Tax=Cohnella nanjingensis TaxID=1387779 RepID=A0A7X0VHZ5_9BACL|nr:response regulator [Cohnella nanjingensis]MBB6673988.1 response regulator [Cohnella nanjingensis]